MRLVDQVCQSEDEQLQAASLYTSPVPFVLCFAEAAGQIVEDKPLQSLPFLSQTLQTGI